MGKSLFLVSIAVLFFLLGAVAQQEFPPSCNMCSASYISAEELREFLEIPQVDQQVRSLDIGKTNLHGDFGRAPAGQRSLLREIPAVAGDPGREPSRVHSPNDRGFRL